MKLKILFLLLMLSAFSLHALAFVQEAPTEISDYFVSVPMLLIVIPIVTEWIKVKLNLIGRPVQYLSWSIGLILSFIGYFFKLGMFAEMTVWETILTGLEVALITNGIADLGVVTWFFDLFKKKTTQQ